MSRILKRLLKRQFGKDFDTSSLEPDIQALLLSVGETFEEFEKEKRFLENTLNINSDELYEANRKIIQKNEDLNTLLDENSKLLENRIEENLEIGTQLKQYKQAMDSALLVNTFDLEGTLTFVNDNFSQLSGFNTQEMIGKKYDFMYSENNPDALSEQILQTVQSKEIWNGLLKYTSRYLHVYDLNATIFPILNVQNEIVEYMSIFQDVTEIENSRQKAVELDRSKSLFIANMSHELRTPLNAIIGFSQLLRMQKNLSDKVHSYVEKINYSGEHLLKLINSILDFSKIEAGEVRLEHIKLDLYSIISTALVQQENQAKEKNIGLHIDYEENLTKLFLGDSLRLTQIITNLCSNALKFTHKGEVRVSVAKVATNRIKIAVNDTGIGLSESDQTKLFKEFSQADNSTTREYGGTGLGLSISQALVKLMHGEIWVESEKGVGSSFIFEIDLEEYAESEDKLPELMKSLSALKDKSILLVEDNKMNQLLVVNLLEDSKINIDIANNGLEAVQMKSAVKEPYNLILMDIQMPVMNGFEASRKIRESDKEIPIIALSANISRNDTHRIKEAGINEHLFKPIDTNKFFSCLLKYLDKN